MSNMLARRSGVMIHVNSPAAEMVWPSCTGYAAARFALRGLHEALSQDLAGTGVRSCQVIFGEVSSEYWENNPGSRAYVPKISKTIPVMTPEACARVLLRVAERPRRQVVPAPSPAARKNFSVYGRSIRACNIKRSYS